MICNRKLLKAYLQALHYRLTDSGVPREAACSKTQFDILFHIASLYANAACLGRMIESQYTCTTYWLELNITYDGAIDISTFGIY